MAVKKLESKRSNPRELRPHNPSSGYQEAIGAEQRDDGGSLMSNFRGSHAEALLRISSTPATLKPSKASAYAVSFYCDPLVHDRVSSLADRDYWFPTQNRYASPTCRQPQGKTRLGDGVAAVGYFSFSSLDAGVHVPSSPPRRNGHKSRSPAKPAKATRKSASGKDKKSGAKQANTGAQYNNKKASVPKTVAVAQDSGKKQAASRIKKKAPQVEDPPESELEAQFEDLGPGSDSDGSIPDDTQDGLGAQAPARASVSGSEYESDSSAAVDSAAEASDSDDDETRTGAPASPGPGTSPIAVKPKKSSPTSSAPAAKASASKTKSSASKTKSSAQKPSATKRSATHPALTASIILAVPELRLTVYVDQGSDDGQESRDYGQAEPEKKKPRTKSHGTSFPTILDEDLPPQGVQSRKAPPSLIRPMGGKGSGTNGQFVVRDMDSLEKATFTTMCSQVRYKLVRAGKAWASAGDLQAEVNDLLTQARVRLNVEIDWHVGFQSLLYQNAKSWISACGADSRDVVVKHYNLKLVVGGREKEFDTDSQHAAAAALDSAENLRADGQARIVDDSNLFLGTLLHTVAVTLLGPGFSLPALMLDEGAAERAVCVEVAFGVLGIAYAGILRTLEHASNGRGSYNFNEDYQQECGNLMVLAKTLTVEQQNVVMLKLWALAGAHSAGLGRLAEVAASADAARLSLFRRRS
ncbi:hypothetical protein P7C70_g5065, partial [Phenoliferia sp. Uapishka_3]